VCQTQSYGPEARGGYSKAEVVISDKPIDYPKVMKPDFLLTMNQAACDAYYLDLKPDGLLVVDSTLVTQIPTSRVISLPFTEIARNEIGKEMVANMVALGAVGYLSKRVSIKSLTKALLARVPKRTEEMNQEALNAGLKAAEGVVLDELPRFLMPDEEEAM
jgi:2-oxoglutarate ferredoxin oxidoreductase subunit gamma